MSMNARFVAAGDDQIASLLARPTSIESFLDASEDDSDDLASNGDGGALDIDKAWHGLHFLLNGHPWQGTPPLDFIIAGGTEIGEVDVGYGPARGFTSAEVRTVAAALAPLEWPALFARWDDAAIRGAQLHGVNPDDRDSEDGYLGDHYQALKTFFAALARDGLGVVAYLH